MDISSTQGFVGWFVAIYVNLSSPTLEDNPMICYHIIDDITFAVTL